MIAIEKDRIYSFVDYKATQNFILKTLRLPYNVDYMTVEEFAELGFQEVIDAPLKENQYLGEVYKKEGKFYRDAIDIIQPKPEDLFDWDKCSRELYGVLTETRQIQLHSWQFTIVQLMQVKNFAKLKQTIEIMREPLQLITIEEKELFYVVMLDNGIELNNY